ncbi:hypothetical protein [Streptomyces sp. NBC_00690]|uniref:hypothetical protein n=1 Tax=Streptomyces sp. NBC_00690 TaxID=2975808 RepID=UPI002E2D35A7|nr:hypothetical protein [Streptomyces sp. NBC_00690]
MTAGLTHRNPSMHALTCVFSTINRTVGEGDGEQSIWGAVHGVRQGPHLRRTLGLDAHRLHLFGIAIRTSH